MRLDHPIFQGVVLDLVELETPAHYRSDYEAADLPAQMQGWRVQDGEIVKEIDYGLVSSPYGFEDSPDAEWISSGVNSKGPHSVALGRHGNFFLWGFAGDPTQMTASGRKVFLNVLRYMRGFEGRTALVERVARSRESAPRLAHFMRGREQDDRTLQYCRQQFGVDIRQATELDPDRLLEHLRLHREHLTQRRPDGPFQVDADLVELDTSNRELAFFEAIAGRLQASPDDELALRLLDRYAQDLKPPRTAPSLEAWLAEHRVRLFFSDVGGYRWFLAPNEP